MLSMLVAYLSAYFQDEEGQGMAEYGLILALIAVVVIAAVGLIGTNLDLIFDEVAGKLAL